MRNPLSCWVVPVVKARKATASSKIYPVARPMYLGEHRGVELAVGQRLQRRTRERRATAEGGTVDAARSVGSHPALLPLRAIAAAPFDERLCLLPGWEPVPIEYRGHGSGTCIDRSGEHSIFRTARGAV